jgi:hypothetical protein
MDIALEYADHYFFTPYIYPESWPESDVLRQFISLNLITDAGGAIMYLVCASLSYILIFDKRLLKHPQTLEVIFGYFVHQLCSVWLSKKISQICRVTALVRTIMKFVGTKPLQL